MIQSAPGGYVRKNTGPTGRDACPQSCEERPKLLSLRTPKGRVDPHLLVTRPPAYLHAPPELRRHAMEGGKPRKAKAHKEI